MKNNFDFREIVIINSADIQDQHLNGLVGIIIGKALDDNEEFAVSYLITVFDNDDKVLESTRFYPHQVISTGKKAHCEFNKSNCSLRVSQDGDVLGATVSAESFSIYMESLKIFSYSEEEDLKSISIKLKNEVLANNKSYEIVSKSCFNKWDDGKKISPNLQLQIMKEFKEGMLSKFGVEIDYE